MSDWSGKTVWLTGASSGIGRALALELVKLDCIVIISGRRKEILQEIAKQAPQHLIPLAMDVTASDRRSQVQAELADRVESIDIAIFSAGVVEYENHLDFDIEQYRRVFEANFFGLVNSVAIALPLLRKSRENLRKSNDKPYIVGLTSLSMLVGFPRAEMYGSSKAAADYFLKSLRTDLSPEEFDVSIVRPGFVKTPMTSVNDFPMPFLMTAEEAAARILAAMNKRKLLIEFPLRLTWLLKLFSRFPSLWHTSIATRMSRQQKIKKA
jgi:short-subunit dehydrogenase